MPLSFCMFISMYKIFLNMYFKSLQAKGLQNCRPELNVGLPRSRNSLHKISKYVDLKNLIVCSFAAL